MSLYLIYTDSYIHFELECFRIGIVYLDNVIFTLPYFSIFEAGEPDGTERDGVRLSKAD